MKRLLLLLVLPLVLLAAPAFAVVPSTMSYQGVLMDGTGALVPDGDYSLTFRLYTAPSGGAALWSETHDPVTVSRGGFSVILGSVDPLLTVVPFDLPYWLGITVGGGTELVPRVQLASSPYSLSLRLPFAGGYSSSSPALAIANAGDGPAITADRLLAVGTTSSNGVVRVYENGVVGAEIGDAGGLGAYLHMFDTGGTPTATIEPDGDGNAGFFVINAGPGAFYVDGNNGTGSASVYITGAGSLTCFQTNQTGDVAVLLPDNSVSAAEILDEPGIAQGHVTGIVGVPIGATMGDIVTVTLSTPASGYVVVEACGQHAVGGNATAVSNYAEIQIDETAGGTFDLAHDYISGYYNSTAGTHTGLTFAPISIRRTYYKAAGVYTFRLEAYGTQNVSLSNYIYNPTITATFYPTSYGSVTAAVTPEEASQFSDVQRAVSAGQLPQGTSSEGLLVDLRELELRATQARLQAEQAQRQLIEARLAQQRARAATKPATTQKP
jgi:hypothetical protein